MTKEEEETIKNIKIYIHDWINESVDEDGYERYAIDAWDKEFINDIETVLSMLKEKDTELKKKDKIIDLMAKRIEWLCKSNGILLDKEHDENFTQEDIKKYFERKVKNEL